MSTATQREITREIFNLKYDATTRQWRPNKPNTLSGVGRIVITLEKDINPRITTWRAPRPAGYLADVRTAYLDTRTLRLAGNVYKAFGFEALCGFIDGTKTGGDVCGQRREA